MAFQENRLGSGILAVSLLLLSACSDPGSANDSSTKSVAKSVEPAAPAAASGQVAAGNSAPLLGQSERPEAESVAAPDSVATAASLANLPTNKPGEMRVEGMNEPVLLHLVRAQRLPIVTYYPADMAVEELVQNDLPVLRFVANYGGTLNPNVFFEVTGLPAGQDETVLIRRLRQQIPNVRISTPRGSFVIREYSYSTSSNPPASGRLLVTRHGGRYFVIRLHAPLEALDGLAPRAAIIQSHWRWADTGTPLAAR